jgi:hypothetical protein
MQEKHLKTKSKIQNSKGPKTPRNLGRKNNCG